MTTTLNLKRNLLSVLIFLFSLTIFGQKTNIIGKIVDAGTNKPISNVELHLSTKPLLTALTESDGTFNFQGIPLPLGEQTLIINAKGFQSKQLPIVINKGKTLDLMVISLEVEIMERRQIGTILLSDQQLSKNIGGADNIAGLLQATKDVYLSAAAYDFSATFYNPRGLDSKHGKVLINGILMNDFYNGRPDWSLWGGLNDAQRNRTLFMGASSTPFVFGGLAGTTNIDMRASAQRKGGKISYALANRSYTGRVSASYNTGLLKNGWSFSLLFARRFGKEGFRDGTLYNANSFYAAVSKKLNDKHSLSFTAFYVPSKRGKGSPNTQEVYAIKDTKYNAYWGYQDGEIRNSRVERMKIPVFFLNHDWTISTHTHLNTSIAYKFGEKGNSRLGYDDVVNPAPTYYRKLPSYAMAQNPADPATAYYKLTAFENDGQVNWEKMYATNQAYSGPARYYLYEDRNDDQQITANTVLNTKISKHLYLAGALSLRQLESENFAAMLDLLGAKNYLDIDTYSSGDEAQSDLSHPNRLINEGQRFGYNYTINALTYKGFLQGQLNYKHVKFYLGGIIEKTNYQRIGHYKNGNFPTNSLGKSKKLNFITYGAKFGGIYKMNGNHYIKLNASYFTAAPSIRNSFSNSRQNNETVIGLTEEINQAVDLSYYFRSSKVKARLTGYYSFTEDATDISFFYADGISGLGRNQTNAFVQEVLTGVNKRRIGVEVGIEAQITPTIKLKGAAGIGQFTYANNPNLYLTSDDFDKPIQYGKSSLKNYHIAGGPERAYQLGFEYRDPNYWFFGATANHFSNAYLDVAPLTRTQNFYLDVDGIPFNNYDKSVARKLLKQEEFNPYWLVNFIGGKSWKVNDYYIGFFGVISNVLDQVYKTGGFEQARNANYRELLADSSNKNPVFGAKYWYGYGTTFYLNFYIRF